MSDERIHKHYWQGGRCKTCGVEQRQTESELAASRGWKHEPVTSEQAKQIIEVLKGIKTWCGWILLFVIYIWMYIWMKTLFLK